MNDNDKTNKENIDEMKIEYMIGKKALKQIQKTLEKGDRVEIIPKKDGVKILSVHRDEIK